jgi:hypothetical protein
MTENQDYNVEDHFPPRAGHTLYFVYDDREQHCNQWNELLHIRFKSICGIARLKGSIVDATNHSFHLKEELYTNTKVVLDDSLVVLECMTEQHKILRRQCGNSQSSLGCWCLQDFFVL